MSAGNVSGGVVDVPLQDLVLERELQCRVAMDGAAIEEYADALADGAVFPPVVAVRAEDGRLYLVDGWHRVAAARKAERATIRAEIRDGTRRDALRLAAGANGAHGVRRTQADKRRAVVQLLRDAEIAATSSRKVGELAGVSHTFVNKVRAEFKIEAGQVLDDARIEQVEGTLPPAWERFVENAWQQRDVRRVRLAATPAELARARREVYFPKRDQAVLARLDELAVQPWPWPEDKGVQARAQRAARVDTLEDVEAVLLARDCPLPRVDLWAAWLAVDAMTRATYLGQLPNPDDLRGRPALAAELAATTARLEAIQAEQPANWSRALREMPESEALATVAETSDGHRLNEALWRAQGRLQAALVARVRAVFGGTDCRFPGCAGLVVTAKKWPGQHGSCLVCNRDPGEFDSAMQDAADCAREVIEAGLDLVVDDVRIDRLSLAVLREIQALDRILLYALADVAGEKTGRRRLADALWALGERTP